MARCYFMRYKDYSASMDLIPVEVSVDYTETSRRYAIVPVTLSISRKGRSLICYIAPHHLIITSKV